MALFVDRELPVDANSIQVELAWHSKSPLLAVGAYSEDRGGFVRVIDTSLGGGLGLEEALPIPPHPTAQVSALLWHPYQRLLIVGWENGEIYMYDHDKVQCMRIEADASHQSAVALLKWSTQGKRLITADRTGSVIGWRVDPQNQLAVIFHHELKDELRGLVFCSNLSTSSDGIGGGGGQTVNGMDISGLARAAVAGDETALDLFTSWNTNANNRRGSNLEAASENLNCYAGSASGIIYFLNENGSCMEVLQADGAVKYLLHYAHNDLIIVITESMVIGQFQMEADGSLSEVSKIKISTRSKENHTVWVGSGLLAIASGETNIRVWDLKTDDNFVLPQAPGTGSGSTEIISSLDFCNEKNILAAGTNAGYVFMWKYGRMMGPRRPTEDDWQALPRVHIGPTIRSLTWGGGNKFLAINCVRQVFILTEQALSVDYSTGVSAIQTSPSNILVTFHGGASESTAEVAASVQVSGLKVTHNHMFLYGSGGKMLTYEQQKDINHVMSGGEFIVDSVDLVTSDDNSIYTVEGERINIRSFQGTIKHTLFLNDEAGGGGGLFIQVGGQHLMVCTKGGVVKIWDVSKRDMRPHCHPINIREKIADYSSIKDVQMNITGSHISVILYHAEQIIDPKLYIYDIEKDVLGYFNFASGHNDSDDITVPPNSAQSHMRSNEFMALHSKSVSDRYVVNHCWDLSEANFLACFTKSSAGAADIGSNSDDNEMFTPQKSALVSLFVHEDLGVVVHDSQAASDGLHRLIAVEIPFMITLEAALEEKGPGVKVTRNVMSDFVGLEESDKATRDAVIKFSFYLSIGNMEEAFKSIKTIKNQNVWGNLARMCVKSQRLDVASICLGKMEHAAGARALRQINAQNVDKDVKTAVLAIYLGMTEEAEQLLLRCKRYDLLNKLYQDSGQWDKALEIAENADRIHLRSTFYNFAKHLEKKGDISGAIQNYEKSGTHRFEVPRLLFEDWNILEAYIQKTNDKELKRWWAQYMESTGEMELALQYYELAEDYLSLVRVYSYCDNLEKAAEIANSSGDKAACYHLARQYENIDNITEAIHFFSKAQAYSNAIRICKEHGFNEQLWNMAVLAGPNEKLDAAKYFETAEQRPQYDKAVILYEKAGYVGKALDLAFKTKQHNVLQYIATNFTEDTDPALLDKTAGFFLQHDQYEKAVDLYVASVQAIKALELCLQYNINITEEMAEKLSGDSANEKATNEEKLRVLNKIAEVSYQQGNYHLATKKWTQSGNRLQAMKSLLKSGDTEKIIFFANVSRQREIYILAGNYLQTLDWRNNSDVMKNIITFYSKAKGFDLLAMFYHACADVEIDEYQNYEKAHGALAECIKCLNKAEITEIISARLIQVARNMELIARFVDCQKLYETNANKAIEGCKSLIKEENVNVAVRKGDIYGFIIEHYVKAHNHKQAYALIQQLKQEIPNVNLAYYVNTDILLSIEKALGVILQVDTEPKYEEAVD